MTSRQQRRAAEREARKQTSHTGGSSLPLAVAPAASPQEADPQAVQLKESYASLIAAATPAILFPGEEGDRYRAHLRHFFQQHQPEPGLESDIVKRLADLQWRLTRIAALEAGIMLLGRRKYAALFAEAPPDLIPSLIDAQTLSADALTIKRLYTQEAHLRRYYAADSVELARLQKSRRQSQDQRLNNQATSNPDPLLARAASLMVPCIAEPSLTSDEDGFEFSFQDGSALYRSATGADFLEGKPGTELASNRFGTENTIR